MVKGQVVLNTYYTYVHVPKLLKIMRPRPFEEYNNLKLMRTKAMNTFFYDEVSSTWMRA